MPTRLLTTISMSTMSRFSIIVTEPRVYSLMYSHLPMQPANSNDTANAQRLIITPSATSCIRSQRVLSPITLRVLMLRRRIGARAMEKLAKFMSAMSNSSIIAIQRM